MNSCRILARLFILFIVFFLVCGERTAIAADDPVTPQAKAEKKVQPAKISKPKENRPAFLAPAGLPVRNAIGCVLPLSGRYGDYGNKALDAILLAAGIFNKKNKTSRPYNKLRLWQNMLWMI